MGLYVITICGDRFYFCADLSKEECDIVNHVCNQLSKQAEKSDPNTLYQAFFDIIKKKINHTILPIQIKDVFRIR